jgi:NAD(P)-dependent dehydrogenase (short-subunit alcohol dehydrogenase family)
MLQSQPLISTGNFLPSTLSGQIAIVTGGGGGIGFETARALAWLGARVIIAEINKSGKIAAERINQEMRIESAIFIKTDVGDEHSVNHLAKKVITQYGKVDILFNNATIAPLGAVKDLPFQVWDASYRVNLRGPVLLAKQILPGMIERNYGVFVSVTSEGLAFMGAYECFKAAQLHLARTIDAELEGTGVITFTIGPGAVYTDTLKKSIPQLAGYYGKTIPEMELMFKEHIISVEAAGAGFAAAAALAAQFRGQEIGAKQALMAAGIQWTEESNIQIQTHLTPEKIQSALSLCNRIRTTLDEQHKGWLERPIFERQWVLRDFKKQAGMPVEHWLETLDRLAYYLKSNDFDAIAKLYIPVTKLAQFYQHLQELAKGYIKDPQQLADNLQIVRGWQTEAEQLAELISPKKN